MKSKVFLRTFGCQMNVRDSELISGLLQGSGYSLCDNDKDANIVIFNTCAVRKHAEDRIWSLIGAYKGKKIIGLAGCMAQNYAEKAFERDPAIKFVVGPQDIHKLPEILSKIKGKDFFELKVWETQTPKRPEEVYHQQFYQDKDHAHVVISEGCSNFCSYCVVPYVRGATRHRKHGDILKEVRAAIDVGITKITLLGQNVNAYHDAGINFAKLLELVNKTAGLKEFGFFTSHPKDAAEDIFKAIRDLDKLAKRLHLPVQSGSDRILKLMNRGYKVKDYLALIESYRKIVKGGQLTTDVIVGFPTETAEEFRETCDLFRKVEFDSAYIFKYSARPGTGAANIAETLKPGEKEERHRHLLELQRKISKKLQNAKK